MMERDIWPFYKGVKPHLLVIDTVTCQTRSSWDFKKRALLSYLQQSAHWGSRVWGEGDSAKVGSYLSRAICQLIRFTEKYFVFTKNSLKKSKEWLKSFIHLFFKSPIVSHYIPTTNF